MALIAQATPVLPGHAWGRVLKLAEPLSFWGGVDPRTGCITDPASGAVGLCVAHRVLVLPATRGSSSASAVMLQLLYAGLAPAAVLLGEVDAILGLGILVAREMNWPTIPLLCIDPVAQNAIADGLPVTIDESGGIRRETPAAQA